MRLSQRQHFKFVELKAAQAFQNYTFIDHTAWHVCAHENDAQNTDRRQSDEVNRLETLHYHKTVKVALAKDFDKLIRVKFFIISLLGSAPTGDCGHSGDDGGDTHVSCHVTHRIKLIATWKLARSRDISSS